MWIICLVDIFGDIHSFQGMDIWENTHNFPGNLGLLIPGRIRTAIETGFTCFLLRSNIAFHGENITLTSNRNFHFMNFTEPVTLSTLPCSNKRTLSSSQPKQPDGKLVLSIHVAIQVCFPASWLPGDAIASVNMSLIICQFALLMTETVTVKMIKKLSKQ